VRLDLPLCLPQAPFRRYGTRVTLIPALRRSSPVTPWRSQAGLPAFR